MSYDTLRKKTELYRSGEKSGMLSLQGYGPATEISSSMPTFSVAWEMLKILADGLVNSEKCLRALCA